MTHAIGPFWPLLAASAFLYLLLGAWVLTLTPRRRQTTLLGAFAIAFGLIFAPFDVLVILHLVDPPALLDAAIQSPPALVAYGLALALAWTVPEPLEDERLLWVAGGVGFGLALVQTIAFVGVGEVLGVPVDGLHLGLSSLMRLSFGAVWAAVILLALRAQPGRGATQREVTQLALLAVALGLLRVFTNGMQLVHAARASAVGDLAIVLRDSPGALAWLAIAGLWGLNMVRAGLSTTTSTSASFIFPSPTRRDPRARS